MKSLEEKIGDRLKRLGATVAVAESCTGGLIAHRITNVSGSSDYFESGIVSYSNRAKADLLGIPQSLIDAYGPVSEPVARRMAEGIRDRRKTTFGLGTTGVAGPLGGTPETPVGTVFISLALPHRTIARRFHFTGGRRSVKESAAQKALEILLEYSASDEKEG